jgi:hypothetical protein
MIEEGALIPRRPNDPSTVAVLAHQIAAAAPESAAEIGYPAANGSGVLSSRGDTFNNRSAAGDRPSSFPSMRNCAAAVSATPTAGCRRRFPVSGLMIVVPSSRYLRTAVTRCSSLCQAFVLPLNVFWTQGGWPECRATRSLAGPADEPKARHARPRDPWSSRGEIADDDTHRLEHRRREPALTPSPDLVLLRAEMRVND